MINDQSSVINYQSSIFRDKKHTSSKHTKERAQKLSPEAREKKDSSAKPLNDIKNSKRKSAQKLSPEAREKMDSFAKSLNDIKKSKRKSAKKCSRRHEKKG